MELFEILFILFFILIPVLEGIRKNRQSPGPEETEDADRPARTGRTSYEGPSGAPPPRGAKPEADTTGAADMLPDDLWEVLTGERRQRPEPVEEHVEDEEEYQTWRDEPAWEPEEEAVAEQRFEPSPWLEDAEPVWEESVPEAIEVPLTRVDLRSPPPREERSALGSAIGEAPAQRRRSPLMASLQSTQGLRQAVLLKEILGRPKGLEF